MTKIYLSPSDQRANLYACDNTISEAEMCRKIALKLQEKLGAYPQFDVRVGEEQIGYVGRAKDSNNWGANMHIPIHTNAGGGAGTVVFTFDYNGDGAKLGGVMIDYLSRISGRGGTIRAERGLYEINNTYAPCCYVEVDFHDNPVISRWIVEHVDNIAQAMCQAILEYYGVTEKKKVFYRVYAGVRNKEKKDADVLTGRMKEKGIDAFTVKRGKNWLCQVGQFELKSNAQNCLKKVQSVGVGGFIKTVKK